MPTNSTETLFQRYQRETEIDAQIQRLEGWQPIETAPKDRDVLLFCPLRGAVRGRWDNCGHANKPRPYWTHDRERLFGVSATRSDQPTHWMPLPEAPMTEAK